MAARRTLPSTSPRKKTASRRRKQLRKTKTTQPTAPTQRSRSQRRIRTTASKTTRASVKPTKKKVTTKKKSIRRERVRRSVKPRSVRVKKTPPPSEYGKSLKLRRRSGVIFSQPHPAWVWLAGQWSQVKTTTQSTITGSWQAAQQRVTQTRLQLRQLQQDIRHGVRAGLQDVFLPPRKLSDLDSSAQSELSDQVQTTTQTTASVTTATEPVTPVAPRRRRRRRLKTTLKKGVRRVRRAAWALVEPFIYVIRRHPIITITSLLMTGLIFGGAYWTFNFVFKDLPQPEDLMSHQQILTTKILDRNGELLYRIYKDENRSLISLSEVPQNMINATVAIEDKEYFNHHGFSVRGIVRATLANIRGESLQQGGSTITQQLVKNTLLSSEKTFRRKIREVILAVLVDGRYTKEEVLEMYFNQVAYGGATYGIEEAAYRFFDKPARELTLAESALLAGLPQAPSVYSPFGSNPELAYERQAEVLRRMVEDGYISLEQADAAKKEELHFKTDTIDIQAPHFVMYVRKLLAEQYGEDVLFQGGLEVRTTLDLALHNEAQAIVTNEVESLSRLRVSNGAALITNPHTGEILSMVGSKNYFDFKNDGQVNVTLRPRQPGSAIKALTYALAFERGRTPSSMIDDSPITFMIPGSRPYAPKNYDGTYHGQVTLRQALASSYNIPAVKLAADLGVDALVDKGQEMGITTWGDRSRFGLSLTLGGGEVLMTDLAKLYGTFATQGYTVDLNPILEIKNARGEILYRNNCALLNEGCPKRKTLDSRVAYYLTDILKDNNARTPAFGPRSFLQIPNQEVAVKTGTTNNLRDNWTIGYTSDRLVATWVGNNNNTPMSYVASGVTGASPIWNEIIKLTLDDATPHRFPPPDGLIKVEICAVTGTLPCRGCPAVREEYFVPGTEPTQACNPAYFTRPLNTPQPTDPSRDRILEGLISE